MATKKTNENCFRVYKLKAGDDRVLLAKSLHIFGKLLKNMFHFDGKFTE